MTFSDPHHPLWLSEHLNVPAPRKVASSRGRRIVPIGTPTAKKGKSGKSKKREASSSDSPATASKKNKTAAATAGGSRGVVIQEAVAQGPFLIEESASQGVFAPVSKRPIRKTRAGRKTSTAPPFLSLPASAAVRKSARDIVYSERRVSVSMFVLLFIN
jgi:hypothetical protein